MYPYLRNPVTGEMKMTPMGFSWTVFFFGPFVAFVRGDLKWGMLMGMAAAISGGMTNIAFAFFYNNIYRNDLIARGFRPVNDMQSFPPQQIIQQVYVNTGDGFATVSPQPHDPFAARAAQAYANDPLRDDPVFHEPMALDSQFRRPARPAPGGRGGFGRKGV